MGKGWGFGKMLLKMGWRGGNCCKNRVERVENAVKKAKKAKICFVTYKITDCNKIKITKLQLEKTRGIGYSRKPRQKTTTLT
ncbi:MAG: hypothetical protein ACI304_01265 [Lepagella sp.]